MFEKFKNKCASAQEICRNGALKYSVTAECTLELSCNIEAKKNNIEQKLKSLLKKYINSPEKLIQYIKMKGIAFAQINNADGVLAFFGLEDGFIMPSKGVKTLLISSILSILSNGEIKAGFSMPAMIILNKKGVEIYTIARALYKYYGYKSSLPGYDIYSQYMFNKIYGAGKTKYRASLINSASLKEVFACRSAIARDLESINFVINLSDEYSKAKKLLKKL